jgi:glycosyltransferase involved in cell wall biosynthesis
VSQRILHLAGWCLPDQIGGTEHYVDALCRALMRRGFECVVGVPDPRRAGEQLDYRGLPTHRYLPVAGPAGRPGITIPPGAEPFRDWIARLSPDLVHVHTLTEGLELEEVRVICSLGLPIVMTAHLPGLFCMRGTMMRWGREVCDGLMLTHRCSACHLHGQGLPRPLARCLGALPPSLSGTLGALLPRRLGTAAAMPALAEQRCQRAREILGKCTTIVAVCRWLYEALLRNGVPAGKLILSRQATNPPTESVPRERRPPDAPLRLGYLGRYDPIKGVARLVEAVAALPPSARVSLRAHGAAGSPAEQQHLAGLRRLAGSAPHIRLEGPIPHEKLADFFACIDLLAVPSVVLETGPMVVLEAQAHGVPVLGSRLGGIAELVQDGRNGMLVPEHEPDGWKKALASLAANPDQVERWRMAMDRPRTWDDAAAEMARVYQAMKAPPPPGEVLQSFAS